MNPLLVRRPVDSAPVLDPLVDLEIEGQDHRDERSLLEPFLALAGVDEISTEQVLAESAGYSVLLMKQLGIKGLRELES
ncbi:MAG: hypothetical protein ACM3NH_04490 [Candidatus Saccharibacteria bacterium]